MTTSTAPLSALVLPTPAGPLTVLLTPEDQTVRAAGFAPVADMAARLDVALRNRGVQETSSVLGPVADAVRRYADGDLDALAEVPVAQPGGPFTQRAWQAMRDIAPGETLTYAELAQAAGNPAAVRAAGSACARNLIAPFVPCHRVLRTGGAMGGYYYGLDVKRALLAHESGVVSAA
jgi:methylated-DNA-[protein]-cysteine S-methyltransferase